MAVNEFISVLQAAFPGEQIALPGTEAYATWNASYLAQQESDLAPAAIFRPKSTEDVALFVCLIEPSAVSGTVAFAIRAAGNMPAPGCANIQDGITLDLSLLTAIRLDDERSVVRVAAGAKWQAVSGVVQKAGLGVVGGGGTRGVGGLALAGGISLFSVREGFISDNVVNFQVVLASGHVVNANQDENQDLWIALRGGSNNFGIVTRFDLRTFRQTYPFWGGSVYYFPPSFPDQIEHLVAYLLHERGEYDTHYANCHIMMSIGHTSLYDAVMCINTVCYIGTKKVTTETPPALIPFASVHPYAHGTNTMRNVYIAQAQAAAGPAGRADDRTSPVRCAYMNATVQADTRTLKNAADLYTKSIAPLQHTVEGLNCSFVLQPYSISLLEKSKASGGNSLGLGDPDDTGPLVSILLLTHWKDRRDDERVIGTMKGILDGIREIAMTEGTIMDFIDLNYAADFQNPIASYGHESRHRLIEVSKKYDAKGLFQKGVPGGFKLC